MFGFFSGQSMSPFSAKFNINDYKENSSWNRASSVMEFCYSHLNTAETKCLKATTTKRCVLYNECCHLYARMDPMTSLSQRFI